MTEAPSNPAPETGAPAVIDPALEGRIDFSCRLPLLVLFISAGAWVLVASALEFISSLTFHAPAMFADCAWLSYGRLHPAAFNCLLYGFGVQAGLGVILWLWARQARAGLAQRGMATLGASFWNLGVTLGVLGILAGDSTGFESLEMPGYAALFLALGYLVLGVCGMLTFHQRREHRLFPSQWFMFAALFWFPWIYSTAELLLVPLPVRGVTQAVLAWWYAENLQVVWFGLVGIGAVLYFVPKLSGRELHSHYLALFTFWLLVLFASWAWIPPSAPVPAWMPVLSAIASVFFILPVLTVALNVYRTVGRFVLVARGNTPLSFMLMGALAFLVAGLMRAGAAFDTAQMLHFTWFGTAWTELQVYAFFGLVMFGAIYRILPQLTGLAFSPGLVRLHFWLAVAGIVLSAAPWIIAGIKQEQQLIDASVPFIQIVKSTLAFLRVSTLGELALVLGHVVFLGNLIGIAVRFYRTLAVAAYAEATADLFKPEGAKP